MRGKVELSGTGPFLSFKVDGEPVYAVAVDIHADAKSMPKVAVELDVPELAVGLDADICIPDHTRKSLLALGWKPPEGTK